MKAEESLLSNAWKIFKVLSFQHGEQIHLRNAVDMICNAYAAIIHFFSIFILNDPDGVRTHDLRRDRAAL